MFIDDNNYQDIVDTAEAEGFCTGMLPEEKEGFGDAPVQWDSRWTMTISDITAEVKRRQAKNQSRRSYLKKNGFRLKNQEQTNYCWAYGTVTALEICRSLAGLPNIPLSAANVGSLVTGYRNVGGWGSAAMAHMVNNGVAPVGLWVEGNAGLNRRYATQEATKAAKLIRVEEYMNLPANRVDILWSCLLNFGPVPIGLNWWGHLVCATDVFLDSRGQLWTEIVNSWGPGWGEQGWGYLSESRSVSSNQCCMRSSTNTSLSALQKISTRIQAV